MGIKIIAEAGVNHNGDKDTAFALIKGAKASGADYVKFQTFKADILAKVNAPKAPYQLSTTDTKESQLDMLKQLELPLEWHKELHDYARSINIGFLSTAFDVDSLNFLDQLSVPFLKVPSGEITNAPFLWQIAATKKRLLVSTGMANISEIECALAVVAHAFANSTPPQNIAEVWQFWSEPEAFELIRDSVTLLHCTSNYPTSRKETNLKAMIHLGDCFKLPVGYSDHTNGILVPVAAAALGATVIEKHFTLDRSLPGPDHNASLIVDELTEMISQIREIEIALGDGRKVPQMSEWETRLATRQSLVAKRDILLGEKFSSENIGTARVGRGTSN